MTSELSASAKKVQDALESLQIMSTVVELPASTRTAVEAANAIGCQVSQIVKSIVFMGVESHRPVLVIASGTNRINEAILSNQLHEKVAKADAEFVRAQTGYAIGGVPPVGLPPSLIIFIDQDLFKFQSIWAAAGTPHAVFEFSSADLVKMTGGQIIAVQ
jgi:prolyl-tRNA editing enzyme YbaK/EbsC (Cys-tRNA(Pro) deacylase)